jgi:hypothetical protein
MLLPVEVRRRRRRCYAVAARGGGDGGARRPHLHPGGSPARLFSSLSPTMRQGSSSGSHPSPSPLFPRDGARSLGDRSSGTHGGPTSSWRMWG